HEVGLISDFEVRYRPDISLIDQQSLIIKQIEAGGVGVSFGLDPQHLEPLKGGHFSPENVGRSDSDHLDLRDDEFLNDREIFKLLVEVTGQQQNGVFQFAFAAV